MHADQQMRDMVGAIPPGVAFDDITPAAVPALAEARVAVVTTAALCRPGEPWADQSHEFRVLEHGGGPWILGHNSTNFDRTGFAADPNVAFPVDRLDEMAAEGVIGSVAPRHLSFLGSTFDLSTFRLDTGPAAAALLTDDDVDVVLLTPV